MESIAMRINSSKVMPVSSMAIHELTVCTLCETSFVETLLDGLWFNAGPAFIRINLGNGFHESAHRIRRQNGILQSSVGDYADSGLCAQMASIRT